MPGADWCAQAGADRQRARIVRPTMTDDAFAPDGIEAGRLLFARPFAFLKGCVRIADLPPPDRTEIAFAGRSNVGKSSLINALAGNSSLARTSNTPGRTQELNVFESADAKLRIVDMPGYGFAAAPRDKVMGWTRLIHAYLTGRPNLRRVYLLVDARHGPKASDLSVMNELDRAAVSYQVVLTKADKLNPRELDAVVAATGTAIGRRPAAHPRVIVSSSETKAGIAELRAEIAALLD
jgi:GTP-binding protein